MARLFIGPTRSTRLAIKELRGATAQVRSDMAFGLTGGLARGRNALLKRWRAELRTVHAFTARGLRWERAEPGPRAVGRLHIIPRVWRYLQLQIEGGRRKYRRGFVVYFPNISRSERRRFNASDRFELPLDGSRSRLVLQRRPGRNRPLGIRIFSADYIKRASGEGFVAAILPGLVEEGLTRALEKHRAALD